MNTLATIEITKTGLVGIETLSETEFFDEGRKLAKMEKGLQWAIGDWYNNIPWGDKKEACAEVGLNFAAAMDCGYVSRAYQISGRTENLTFTHHRVLVHDDLPSPDRMRLLQRAAEAKWSSAKMKAERDIIMGIAPPAPTKGFDNGVSILEKSVVDSLPQGTGKATVNKVVSGLKKEAAKLKHEFSDAVEKSAEAKSKTQRENLKAAEKRADDRYEKAVKMKAGVKAFLTKAEFLLIRTCLHPDKNSNPKAEKAFTAFNKLADVKNW